MGEVGVWVAKFRKMFLNKSVKDPNLYLGSPQPFVAETRLVRDLAYRADVGRRGKNVCKSLSKL
jgi:hypothetical protein